MCFAVHYQKNIIKNIIVTIQNSLPHSININDGVNENGINSLPLIHKPVAYLQTDKYRVCILGHLIKYTVTTYYNIYSLNFKQKYWTAAIYPEMKSDTVTIVVSCLFLHVWAIVIQ